MVIFTDRPTIKRLTHYKTELILLFSYYFKKKIFLNNNNERNELTFTFYRSKLAHITINATICRISAQYYARRTYK